MSDTVSAKQRSAIMAQVHSTDTGPELKVRKAVHGAGFRYRLHRADLPGRPDLVFPQFRLAVFVHGCFWHWHGCKRSRMPAANHEYWTRKIERNVQRDRRNQDALKEIGWDIRILWECELNHTIDELISDLSTRRRKREVTV